MSELFGYRASKCQLSTQHGSFYRHMALTNFHRVPTCLQHRQIFDLLKVDSYRFRRPENVRSDMPVHPLETLFRTILKHTHTICLLLDAIFFTSTPSPFEVFFNSWSTIIPTLYLLSYLLRLTHDHTSVPAIQGCRGYGDSHGDSHGYGYGMGMRTVMNPHGFCG